MRSTASTMLLATALIAGLGLPGCARNLDPTGADAMRQQLDTDGGYTSWTTAPGYDAPRPTVGAHGDTATVYINDSVASALASDASLDAWPTGSILVKDSFDDDGQLYRVAAMEKTAEGWVWVEWDETGQTLYSGSPETCTRCHAGGDDFTLAVELP